MFSAFVGSGAQFLECLPEFSSLDMGGGSIYLLVPITVG